MFFFLGSAINLIALALALHTQSPFWLIPASIAFFLLFLSYRDRELPSPMSDIGEIIFIGLLATAVVLTYNSLEAISSIYDNPWALETLKTWALPLGIAYICWLLLQGITHIARAPKIG